MGKLDGKVALITGGASGIGAATVRLFVEQGAAVVIADIDDEKGSALAQELGTAARYQHTDVSQESAVQAAIAEAMNSFGRLDCLFNNAGIVAEMPRSIADMSVEAYEKLMSVSVTGVFLGTKYAAPLMKAQGTGSIINTASIAGLLAGFASHLYSAAKAVIIQFTRSTAMELGESGIRVNCLCPGAVATPFLKKAFKIPDEHVKEILEHARAALAKNQPIHRACLAVDVAQAALWLASDAARFVNGHALVIDGGASGGRLWSAVQEQTKALKNRIQDSKNMKS